MEIIFLVVLLGPIIGLILNWISPEEIKPLNKYIRFASVILFLALTISFIYKNPIWYFILIAVIFSAALIKLKNKWIYFASYLLIIPIAKEDLFYALSFLYGICAGGFIFIKPKKEWAHALIFYILAVAYALFLTSFF